MSAVAVAWVMERGADETVFFIWGTVGATCFGKKGVAVAGSWCIARWPDEASCRATVVNSVDSMELEGYNLAVGPLVLDITQSEAEKAIFSAGHKGRLAKRLDGLVFGRRFIE